MTIPLDLDLAYLAFGEISNDFHIVWYRSMEKAFDELGLRRVVSPKNRLALNVARLMVRLRLVRPIWRSGSCRFIVPVMRIEEYRFFPHAYFSEIVPLCFDCWPQNWNRWESMFRRQRVRLAFFTAKRAADEFRKRIPTMRCEWLPEATEPSRWNAEVPLAKRAIDVLELGRRFERWHGQVVDSLRLANRVHRFEVSPGEIVFPTDRELLEGYSQAKISVCFPQSITHPDRAGDVETTTMRYFESMASGCLVLGHCPEELKEDFGYDPVIPADLSNPSLQVESILNDLSTYEPLRQRNLERVRTHASWKSRFETLTRTVRAFETLTWDDSLAS